MLTAPEETHASLDAVRSFSAVSCCTCCPLGCKVSASSASSPIVYANPNWNRCRSPARCSPSRGSCRRLRKGLKSAESSAAVARFVNSAGLLMIEAIASGTDHDSGYFMIAPPVLLIVELHGPRCETQPDLCLVMRHDHRPPAAASHRIGDAQPRRSHAWPLPLSSDSATRPSPEKLDSTPIDSYPAQFNEFYRQCSRRQILRPASVRP